ncbi:MAG: HNH endonuclease [Proteobacteria bacterium]|nr:HNH endonuclease [Pseudomonadota bacterium]
MPSAPPRPCNQAGCAALTHERFCEQHRKARDQQYERRRRQRDPWRAWYATARWQRLRANQLKRQPLCECEDCRGGQLRVTPATVVDHIVAPKGDAALFFNPTNLQSMSKPHHDAKTAREDGRWG